VERSDFIGVKVERSDFDVEMLKSECFDFKVASEASTLLDNV
jgi:hypothetical protein